MLAFSLTIFPCGKQEDCSESLYFLEIFRRGREKLHCDDYDSDEQTTKIISLGLILILVGEDTHRCVGFYEEDQLGTDKWVGGCGPFFRRMQETNRPHCVASVLLTLGTTASHEAGKQSSRSCLTAVM